MFKRQRKPFPIYDSLYLDIVVSDDLDKLNTITDQSYKEIHQYYAMACKTSFKSVSSRDRSKSGYKNSITIVLNPNNEYNYITPGVIVHESVHAKNMVFERIGHRQKDNNDETEAYFVEYIFNEVNNFYNKVVDGNNKQTADPT